MWGISSNSLIYDECIDMSMKQELQTKKVAEFDIKDLLPVALTIGVAAIAIAYTLQVQSDVQADMTADTAEYNATAQGITAVAKIPAKLGLIVTVVLAAIVIGILLRYLVFR